MESKNTAIILIGYQNDYFSETGKLTSVIEESSKSNHVVDNTLDLLRYTNTKLVITTPIVFTDNYSELIDPVGILKTIQDIEAFKEGTNGAKSLDVLEEFADKIIDVPGKIGLNAYLGTELENILQENNITNIVLAGAVASICIDSTGRASHEKGYSVSVLSDCLSGRSLFELEYYCESIFPLYASVIDHKTLIKNLT